MTDTHIISALMKRRAELADEIEHTQNRLQQMVSDIAGLDTAIRLFDYDYQAEAMKSADGLRRHRDWQRRGEMSQLIFSILRTAENPLTTTEIARAMIANQGLDNTDRRLFQVIRTRVAATLRKQRVKGTVRPHHGPGQHGMWELAQ